MLKRISKKSKDLQKQWRRHKNTKKAKEHASILQAKNFDIQQETDQRRPNHSQKLSNKYSPMKKAIALLQEAIEEKSKGVKSI